MTLRRDDPTMRGEDKGWRTVEKLYRYTTRATDTQYVIKWERNKENGETTKKRSLEIDVIENNEGERAAQMENKK